MEREIISTHSKRSTQAIALRSLGVVIIGGLYILGVLILVNVSSDLFASPYWQ